jgi:serine protease Do
LWWFLPVIATALMLTRLSSADERRILRSSEYTSGSNMRKVFRDVVAKPSHSTVRVYSDGKAVAYGVIVGAEGWILTKASELRDSIRCRFHDDSELDAYVAGVDRETDLAMLKVKAKELHAITFVEEAAVIGSFLATTGTGETPIAIGVLSVAARRIAPLRGYLGIQIEEGDSGPVITEVMPNSGAQRAGLRAGDVITGIAGKVIRDRRQLQQTMSRLRPGDHCHLHLLRDGVEHRLEAILSHPLGNMLNRGALQNRLGGKLSQRRSGFPAAIQHDTVLRPDQCGGAVVDLDGKCVGINIARAGRTESYAITAAKVLSLLDDLKSGKLAPPREVPPPPPLPVTVKD